MTARYVANGDVGKSSHIAALAHWPQNHEEDMVKSRHWQPKWRMCPRFYLDWTGADVGLLVLSIAKEARLMTVSDLGIHANRGPPRCVDAERLTSAPAATGAVSRSE